MRFVSKTQSAFLLLLDIDFSKIIWYCWSGGDRDNEEKSNNPLRLQDAKWRDANASDRGKSRAENL